ncbi:hypothetical protein TNCV_2882171 [Trichonephila clavipes]|nr:hypothetical protein TNCV_2882171 [Trichonephila clavipes]
MAVNDRTASSRQLAARWSTATDESRFNLLDHDGRIRDRHYAGEHCLSEYVIERHCGLTPGVMSVCVWGGASKNAELGNNGMYSKVKGRMGSQRVKLKKDGDDPGEEQL